MMGLVGLGVVILDQLSKITILRSLALGDERVVLDGFFKIVHWTNRGAAWSLFNQAAGSNEWLAVFAVLALVVLFLTRHHFDVHTRAGQIALGIIAGGIAGNLLDRFIHGSVIDFIYFYLERRGGGDLGFPAFNLADTAICMGVVLLFFLSWQKDESPRADGERAGVRGE
jgi:signal peptidase II